MLYLFLYFGVLLFASSIPFWFNSALSVFSLIGVFVCVSFFLFWMQLEFFGLVMLIVYVGAIAVLFLLVIMLIGSRSLLFKNNSQLDLDFYFLLLFKVFFLFEAIISAFNKFYYSAVLSTWGGNSIGSEYAYTKVNGLLGAVNNFDFNLGTFTYALFIDSAEYFAIIMFVLLLVMVGILVILLRLPTKEIN